MKGKQARTSNLSATLARTAQDCVRVLGAEACALFLLDAQNDHVQIGAATGLSEDYLDAITTHWKALPISRAGAKRSLYFWEEAATVPALRELHGPIRREGIQSIANIPLIIEKKFQGWLGLYYKNVHPLSAWEKRSLRTFADLAAVAIHNSRLAEREREASFRLNRLHELALRISASIESAEVLQAIAAATVELLNGNQSRIYLLDAATGALHCKASHGLTSSVDDAPRSLKLGVGLGGRVAQSRRPLNSPDIQKDPGWINRSWARAHGLHSFLCVPLLSANGVLGLINCLSRGIGQFRDADLALLESLAGHAVAAIEKAQLYERAREESQRLATLNEISRMVTSSLDLNEILGSILHAVQRITGATHTQVWLAETRIARYTCRAALTPDGTSYPENVFLEKGKGPTSRVIEQGKTLAVANLSDYSGWVFFPSLWEGGKGPASYLGVPLFSQGNVTGALACFTMKPREWPEGIQAAVAGLASHAAVAIENARLYGEARERATTLQILDEIARAIDSTLDLEELFRITAAQVKRVLPCRRSALHRFDAEKASVYPVCIEDDDPRRRLPLDAPYPIAGSFFEEILETRRPFFRPDTFNDPNPRGRVLAEAGLLSALHVPIMSEEACIGFLNVASERVDAFTERHGVLLQSVADHLAIAMKNAELYGRVRESSERLNGLIRNATDGIVTTDMDGIVTAWNPAAENIYGYTETEMLGADILRIFLDPEKAKAKRDEYIRRIRKGETLPSWEALVRRKDGTVIEVSFNSSAIRDSAGRLIGISGVHRDVTARKRAEEALRKSEEKYRHLFEEASDAVYIINEKGKIIDCNQHFCELHGYAKQEILGKDISEIVAPDFHGGLKRRKVRVLRGERLLPFETVNLKKDGTRIDVEVSASPIEIGGRKHVLYFMRDIRERKQAEQDVARFRTFLDQAGEALFMTDVETGRFVDVNDTSCKMLGYSRSEMLRLRPRDIVVGYPLHSPEEWAAHVRRIKEAGTVLLLEQDYLVVKGGGTIPVEVSVSCRNFGGRDYLLAVVRDIRERKRAEEMLIRSQKLAALGRLTAGMTHEILNPANIIGMRAQMLSKKAHDPEAVKQASESIHLNVQRIAKICGSLRRFSREGKSSVTRFDLKELAGETVAMVEPQARVDGISFSIQFPKGPIFLEADRDQIAQVFLNLFSNARDAMPKGGRVTIKAQRFRAQKVPWVRLLIADEGMGMTEEECAQIFDPFFTTKDEDKGTGLGLSIVHGIIENHEGRINVQSEVGQGTTFQIELPLDQPGQSMNNKNEGQPPKALSQGRTPEGSLFPHPAG